MKCMAASISLTSVLSVSKEEDDISDREDDLSSSWAAFREDSEERAMFLVEKQILYLKHLMGEIANLHSQEDCQSRHHD